MTTRLLYDYIPKSKRSKSKTPRQKRNVVTYNVVEPSTQNERYYLGDIWIGTTNNVFPDKWTKSKAKFVTTDDIDKIILEFDNTIVVVNITTDLQFLKDLLFVKIICVRFQMQENNNNVSASLYLSSLPLPKFNSKVGNVLKTVFSLIFNISPEYNKIEHVESSVNIEAFSDLYKSAANHREKNINIPKTDVQHAQLKPTLRPYQVDAICWMIHREQMQQGEETLHPLYEEVLLYTGSKVYFDKYTGYVDIVEPTTQNFHSGGILADEMGLGKTVEVLACILMNPKPADDTMDLNSESLNEDQTCPVVEKQSKKRKLPKALTKVDDVVEIEAKKLKVPEEWVKSKSNKSNIRIALERWYENMLSNTKQTTFYNESAVHCICGNDVENDDCFKCVDCSKIQHGSCVGYKENYGDYRCPQCWNLQPLIESSATLIVAPLSLKKQWSKEICKHIRGKLRVLEYEGNSNLVSVYPTSLKHYDLVITTYNVLQNELRLSENGQIITLRRQPKYSVPGSPITRVKWWRLCLDEAQTVETPGQMVSVMSQKLQAHHRWAVTGTPISKDISDLYGLVSYLQLAPYSEIETWNNLLYKPYINGRTQGMHKFLAEILWRTAKNDVIEQINIPKQSIVEHWIEFTAVEKFFYEREHELSSQIFLQKLKNMNLSVSLKSLNKSVLKRIMAPLLALRQACAHHQAVRGRYLATRKHVSSMEDLLNALIAKNINESEEHLRIIICSLNGLAGIYLLLQNPAQAIEEYRKVLQMSARFSKEEKDINLVVDRLQLIHTMHNLAEVIEVFPFLPPTLHDYTLKDECKKMEEEYMERFSKQSFSTLQECLKFQSTVRQLQEKFSLNPGQWFSDILDWISANDLFSEYVVRLQNLLENANVLFKYNNERSILYMVANWDEDIGTLREETMNAINDLFDDGLDECKINIPLEIVEGAMDCHLRPQNKNNVKSKCLLCKSNVILKQYECKLFSMTKKGEVSNAGNWNPREEEYILKALFSLGKARNINKEILNDGEIHLSILEVLKKEFKELRKLWTYLDQQICTRDELDMCKIRLVLKDKKEQSKDGKQVKADKILKSLSNDIANKLESIHMLEEHELDYQRALLHGEERMNLVALEKTLGTHKYLQTLRKQEMSGQSPDPCPICKNVLEKQWNILSCGHCYCLECIQTLLGQTSSVNISCSVCRVKQPIADISFIQTEGKSESSDEIKIKGNFSSKVEAVVKLVIKLKNEDDNIKILVFSNWALLLKLLQIVFTTNGILSEVLLQHNFDKSLDAFKDDSKKITALLLPVTLGSKGLNLIEATHVIFVEPLLNPADELQAIGRIHRIGQTKPTIVHKFLIKNTIEENIYHATASNADEWDKNKVTLAHIKKLFENGSEVKQTVNVEAQADSNVSLDDSQ